MLLARVAEAVYWSGRYLERAEDMSRIVQVHGETHIDLPVGADVGWSPLLDICGADSVRIERLRRQEAEQASGPPGPRVSEATVVGFVVTDRDNPSSIINALAVARDNLRVARPVVPRGVGADQRVVVGPQHRLAPDTNPGGTGQMAATDHRRVRADERGAGQHDAA